MRILILLATSAVAFACEFCGGTGAIRSTTSGGPWSSPTTWNGGAVPKAGDPVVIDAGSVVTLDVATPALKSLKIGGTLRASTAVDSALTAGWVMVSGAGSALEAGSAATPLSRSFTITLTGSDRTANVTGVAPLTTGSKFVMAMDGGTIRLHGASRAKRSWTVLDGTVTAGATSLKLAADPTAWAVGDRICIAPTGFDTFQAEAMTITGISGRTVTFTPALRYPHWGVVQTYDGTVIDARAAVGVLTRNIVIQGDAASDASGYGGHGMVMPGGRSYLEGVQFLRMGQRGLKGRYSWHWHLVDRAPYAVAGVSGAGQYIRSCSFDRVFQRAVNVHGTNNILIEGNVAYDTSNHAYVLAEDGDEMDNIARGNLAVRVRTPAWSDMAFLTTGSDGRSFSSQNENHSSAFWMVNPHQTITGNYVAGIDNGNGAAFDIQHVADAFAESASTYRRRIEVTGNTFQCINGHHGFGSHMYDDFSGFGVMTFKAQNESEDGLGFMHAGNNTFAKCQAAAAWLDNQELFSDNHIIDCTAATHSIHSQFVRNLVVGFSANTQGHTQQGTYMADGASLRDASGYDMSRDSNHYDAQTIADNRFVGLNRPAILVNDGTTWSDAAQAYNNRLIGQQGPAYDRFQTNLNFAAGQLLDRDGTLTGTGVSSVITMASLNGQSVYRATMHSYVTPAASGGEFDAWMPDLADGNLVVPGTTIKAEVRRAPSAAAERALRLYIGNSSVDVMPPAGNSTITISLPTTLPQGWSVVNLAQANFPGRSRHRLYLRVGTAGTNQAPTIALTAPTAGASFTAPASIALTATAADNDGSITKVEFFTGNAKLGEDGTAPYSLQWSNVPAGTYTISAKATDNQGASATSAAVQISVNSGTTLPLLESGLNAEFFDFTSSLAVLPDLSQRTPDLVRIDDRIHYPSTKNAWTGLPATMQNTFASRHTGLIHTTTAGSYAFHLSSDDGSRLWINGLLVVDNNGVHGMRERSGTVTLDAGHHDIRVEFFENSGGAGLLLRWTPAGGIKAIVPASVLFHELPSSSG